MKYVALVNPIAGDGSAVSHWDALSQALITAGFDVETIATRDADHATSAAITASAAGTCVIAVGGDGLARDVAAGVVSTGGTMALIPQGRGNDMAQALNLPFTLPEQISMLQRPNPKMFDVLEANGHIVPGNVYMGIDSLAARIINTHRNWPALVLYRGAAIAAVLKWRRTRFDLRYVTPQGTSVDRSLAAHDIVIANSGRYGHGLHIVPGAELDDGYLDILLVKHGPRYRIAQFLLAAQTGRHLQRSDVEVIRATQVSITADRAVPFGADGDEVTALPAEIRVRPNSLRLLVPSGNQ